MSGEVLTALISAAVTAVSGLLLAYFKWPKTTAEARKTNVEAAALEWKLLKAELDRLTERVSDQDAKIATLEKQVEERGKRERELETENEKLKQEVTRLKLRVKGLEDIFRAGPITEDMKALIAELDRKTGGPDDEG